MVKNWKKIGNNPLKKQQNLIVTLKKNFFITVLLQNNF